MEEKPVRAGGRSRMFRVAFLVAIVLFLPFALLTGFRPNWAFEKQKLSKPVALAEDPSIMVVEYGWLKGSQKSFADGRHGNWFDAVGLTYIGYLDHGTIRHRWSVHLRTSAQWDNEMVRSNWKPVNPRFSISLH